MPEEFHMEDNSDMDLRIGVRLRPTPEEAAMAEWDAYPTAEAFIVSVEYLTDDQAVVVIDTEPSHPMSELCRPNP
jgi:hypothetical protein